MATITAADVNKLRKQTGAGMMDCKNALVEANGDFENAVDILRKRGQKVAAKRADREATEGAVIALTSDDNTSGIVVCVNCETDFVAKNDSFVNLATTIANVALANQPANTDELMALAYDAKMTIGEKLTEQTGVIGEKIEIGGYEKIAAPFVAAYIHMGNKIGTLVALSDIAEEAGRDIAMQAAAMNPVSLDKDSVPADVMERELEVGREQAREEGKPEAMIEKIAMGKLGKFYKENTLVEQQFIKDSSLTVAGYLNSVKAGLKVVDFKRLSLAV
jgi:elongation factor Ts